MRIRPLVVGAVAAGLVLSGCVGAPTDNGSPAATQAAASYTPVTLNNCGFEVTFQQPPKATVTLNQGATEVMLALGLEKQMVGTAYLDDQISEHWKAAYDSIKVLADAEYPSKEAFLAAKPDFAYGSYASAFSEKNVGAREELLKEKIPTYLSPFGCPEGVETAPGTMEAAWNELTEVAKIFGVEDRAKKVIDAQQSELETVKQQAAGKGKKVFWYDNGTDQAFAGAGEGGPQIILDAVGATNIFASIKKGWEDVAWEKVVEADPDVIVMIEASWSTVEAKKQHLESDPVLSKLKAVQQKAYVVVPFSESTPGIRLTEGAKHVSEQIAKL